MRDSEQPENERRLAALMFTDMVGFTTLAQRDEALAMQLLDEQRGIIRPLLAKYGGREVDDVMLRLGLHNVNGCGLGVSSAA